MAQGSAIGQSHNMPKPAPTPSPPASLPRTTVLAVCALGLTQIVAWGTSFYALGVLAQPIMAATGWSSQVVFGGFTVAVLASSAVSTPAGWLMDRWGARTLMSWGFAGLAVTLAALSQVDSVLAYFAAWALTGLAMRFTLYDAAFPALVQVDPESGRRAIAYLTLFGGFASTVGWMAGHWLAEGFGWRATLLIFAASNLLICLPLALFGLPKPLPQKTEARDAEGPANSAMHKTAGSAGEPAYLTGRSRLVALALFSVVMSANAIVFGVGAVQLVPLIEMAGVAGGLAVTIASLKGIAQVGGRVVDLAFGKLISPMMLGRLAIGLLPLSFIALLAFGGPAAAAVFTVTFGVSNGLVTIVRGAVPLALFGPAGYGTIVGVLATPILLFNALAPLGFAWIVETSGISTAAWVLLCVGLSASVAMEVLAGWYRRRSAAAPNAPEANR